MQYFPIKINSKNSSSTGSSPIFFLLHINKCTCTFTGWFSMKTHIIQHIPWKKVFRVIKSHSVKVSYITMWIAINNTTFVLYTYLNTKYMQQNYLCCYNSYLSYLLQMHTELLSFVNGFDLQIFCFVRYTYLKIFVRFLYT